MENSSIWLKNIPFTPSPSLSNHIDVDVLVIGGGITGLSCAYHLINSNLKVCLVEKNQIAHGVSARTTGKLTFLQDCIYSDLKKAFHLETAKLYLNSQIDAIHIVEDIIFSHNIKCDYEKVESFVFALLEKNIKKVKKEKEVLHQLGVEVKEWCHLPDGIPISYGISVSDTGVFHPLKYLTRLKEICEKKRINIYENTKILQIRKKDDSYICETENGFSIKAKKVVLAVHYPYFLVPFFMPLKTYLKKSYILSYPLEENFRYSSITYGKPSISTRFLTLQNQYYKIFSGRTHNLAFQNNDKNHFDELLKHLSKKPEYIWSNKDIMTSDQLPFIGEIEDHLYLATGYNAWGMTNGSLAGKIISDLIQGKENPYQALFHPKRNTIFSQFIHFPLELVSNTKSYVATKINKNKSWYSDRVIFKKENGCDIAIYTDEENVQHIVYNRCPHLKCCLIFNEQEKTWDCPCHGSRFDIDGKCIEGPSNFDISYK